MTTPSPAHLLFSTCPDAASAERIAHALVSERLAACVTRLPGARSTYRWQDRVEQGEEIQLLIKTTAARLDAAIARLQALHPYALPEAIALPVGTGLPTYLAWIDAETRTE
ncbi:MAG: divalent-cation tolerance protein CutA [Pseudomonas sp.]